MSGDSAKTATKSNEEVMSTFQRLRNEQRNLADKAGQIEMDLKEHRCGNITSMGGGLSVKKTHLRIGPFLDTNLLLVNDP